MLAEGDVKSDSPQFSAAVERWEVYFTPALSAGPLPNPVPAGAQPASYQFPPPSPQPPTAFAGTPASHPPPTTSHSAAPAPAGTASNGAQSPAVSHMHIQGRQLVAHVLMDDQHKAALSAVTVTGNVRCTETQTAGRPPRRASSRC